MHDQMQVITHHCPGINAAREGIAKLRYSSFDPGFALFEAFVGVAI
jgi:hypothetical protein